MTRSSDQDLSLVNSDVSEIPPLLKTLNELNKIDIIGIEKHTGGLWDELHANFANNRDSSITGGAGFIV
ncbi:Ulp1 protease family protein [Colletotrichum orchidophilum]|uniref:Ulp1 protease family protein n=1 Tax=Colletotrichum orchidophilum TaxID=1209926 RepID=A0A1G4BSX5_9PEZI|nr:Ulp1 protease family protein [Colletotrichum orchidophilum]OHF04534.1 Ulp1 protease family protein [Colletotrichum orchidophilum]